MNPAKITPKLAAMMSAKDRKALGVLTPEQRTAKAEGMAEKELQRLCENWLTLHGFRRRTPEDIKRPGWCAGWFIHMHACKKNPILLDLLILFRDGRYMEIELKTAVGASTDEQKAIVKRDQDGHRAFVCRSFERFIEIIMEGE